MFTPKEHSKAHPSDCHNQASNISFGFAITHFISAENAKKHTNDKAEKSSQNKHLANHLCCVFNDEENATTTKQNSHKDRKITKKIIVNVNCSIQAPKQGENKNENYNHCNLFCYSYSINIDKIFTVVNVFIEK